MDKSIIDATLEKENTIKSKFPDTTTMRGTEPTGPPECHSAE